MGNDNPICPRCRSEAVYRYGRLPSGKQRFQCQICLRQFVDPGFRQLPEERPACPACGSRMNLYMRGNDFLRFRCSSYPVCRTYLKVGPEEKGKR